MTIKYNEGAEARAIVDRLPPRLLGEITLLAAELGVEDARTIGDAAISAMVGLSGFIFAQLKAHGAAISLADAEERILAGFRHSYAMETDARPIAEGGAS